MFKKIRRNWPQTLLSIVIFSLLVELLFWHYRLALVRYFDSDEVAHLHWGYSLFIGERPYIDFFYLFPPFFLYILAFLFKIFSRSITALISARVMIFIAFLGSAVIIFLLGKKLRSIYFGLLAVFIYSFLPLPSDKLLEVRPDNLATFLSLVGLYLFIIGQDRQGKKKYLFFSGLCYSVSLGIVPKTVFFLIPPMLVLGYQLLSVSSKPGLSSYSKPGLDFLIFILGGLPAVILLLGLVMTYGNPSFAIYSMTGMSSNITAALGRKFYMRSDLFFYPNSIYYGIGDYSQPYIANLVIYIAASLVAIGRLISSLSYNDNKKCLREFLIAATFFVNLFAFVYVYPLKHAQYLIPIAPFVAFYFADLLDSFLLKAWQSKIGRPAPLVSQGVRLAAFIFLLLFITQIGKAVYEEKIKRVNRDTIEKVNQLLATIPKSEPIFDLTGETIFYPNGYYFCCLPYGQYEEALLFHLPDLSKLLKERGTKYVYTGQFERLNVLPAREAKYIRENFVKFWSDGSLLIKK